MDNGNKNIAVITVRGFLGFFLFPNISIFLFRKNFCKKKYAVKLFTKNQNLQHYGLCTFFDKFWEPFSQNGHFSIFQKCPKSKTANESRLAFFRGFQIWDFIQ
jgi:hypothetical protein